MLAGIGQLHVGEAAAADSKGMASSKASDERGAERLVRVEDGGIVLAAATVTQKGLFPYHPLETVKVFPVLTSWGSRRELDSAVEKRL